VSTWYLGVVYQEVDHGRHTRKGDANSLWVLEATAVSSSLPTKVRLLMVQTFIYLRSCMARKCGTRRRRSKQDVSGRESSPQHSSPASRDCSSDVLYGHWATSAVYSLMLPNCVGSTDHQNMEAADGPRRRCDSHSRVAVVSAAQGTDWCGNVKSITEQIQHTLNITKVTAQAKVNQLRRVAPRRSPHHSTPYVVSLRWTHRMMT
jgi:hypothetical protein